MARLHHARLYLLHVEEGVTSQVYGRMSSTAEVKPGRSISMRLYARFRPKDIEVETEIIHSSNPKNEIIRYSQQGTAGLANHGRARAQKVERFDLWEYN